ncbi:phenylpyruvate tautomerase MIF-related protein [Pseudodesulfovibrio senegalensis]|jgi:phenylpyruvate tautomerase PptA (4-oxalocrotonate tautomerase family)|uniref:L-dopachrome isomerase n=1 Tax=Pseudodesulfovibrio senegalensis TaxID=1721087 RepID=A0A6N6N7U5_9BACT|nr:phenylpyruvate tautomerase MIF-related protein [Pseudodesulfovibrio senegalensis]KAB1443419.1 hypothetical protein F8A88_03960 [Pseudodesulfovibrio senegalensis]
MPFCRLETNVVVGKEQTQTLVRGLSTLVADMLGKPEAYVMAVFEPGKELMFGGTDDPAAYVTLQSIGLPREKTPEFSAVMCAFLEDALSIAPDRVYIAFGDIDRPLMGWNSATF